MQFRVFHRTRYLYRTPVRDNYNEVRLRPATEDVSRLEFFLLNVHPPARLGHFRDDFLNYVHYFEIPEPHVQLTIEAQSVINTSSQYENGLPVGVPFAALRDEDLDILQPFLGDSKYAACTADAWRLALDIRNDADDIFEVARSITAHVNANWVYAPNTTTVSTHAEDVFKVRQGVCQDFAHVMISLCRSLRIPARYVSGYLYDATHDSLRGARASHAWCEIHVPGKGWFGLDPTNNTLVDERYIKIATGRDYHDAAPVSGHFDGPPGANTGLEVTLDIERLHS